MELLFLLVGIFDGIIIGMTAAAICKGLFGDTPFARLIRLIFGVGGGIAYALWTLNIAFGDSDDMSLMLGSIIIFAPVILFIVALIVAYMFNGNNSEDNKEQ